MSHPIIERLHRELRSEELDAIVAHSVDNVTYTAGFQVPTHATNRFRRTVTVVGANGFGRQIVVNVEEELARSRSRFGDVVGYDQFVDDPAELLADALEEAGAASGRIALELDYLPAMDFLRLRDRLPAATFVHARDLYFRVRMTKTDEEVAALRALGEDTEQVMGEVISLLRPGLTEREIGTEITVRMAGRGADGVVCQVGSGVRSSVINCKPTDKLIEAGDVVRIEILGERGGFRSNVTRTIVIGPATDEQREIWAVLIAARNMCEAKLRAGVSVAELWRTYRDHCLDEGIQPTLKFLGHGIGGTVHEEPYITDTRDVALTANTTHTLEPLFMVPGRMGFHVEDMYRITTSGFEKLTGTIVPNSSLIEIIR